MTDFDPYGIDTATLTDMLKRIQSLLTLCGDNIADIAMSVPQDYLNEHRDLLFQLSDRLGTAERITDRSLRVFRALQETSCFSVSLLTPDAGASSTSPGETPGASEPQGSTEDA